MYGYVLSTIFSLSVKPVYFLEVIHDLDEQGGLLVIEITALAAFLGLYASYVQRVQELLHSIQSSCKLSGNPVFASSMITLNGNAGEDIVQEVLYSSNQNGSEQTKAFTLKMSQFSLVFAAEEKPGNSIPCITKQAQNHFVLKVS